MIVKTKTLLLLLALALGVVALPAQDTAPLPAGSVITIDPKATNSDAILRELLRRATDPNAAPAAPTAGTPASEVPMSLPPGVVRPMRSGATNAAGNTVRPNVIPSVPQIPAPTPVAAPVAPVAPIAPATAPVAAKTTPPSGPSSPTAVKPGDEKIYDPTALRFQAMPLEQFLEFYGDVVGRTILRPSTLPGATITVRTQTSLTRSELIQMLDSVLALNGITMVLIGEKFVTAVPNAQALQEGAAFNKLPSDQLPEASQYLTHIVQLQHVKPSEVIPVIQPFSKTPGGLVAIEAAGVVVLRDFAINIKRMLELIEKVDLALPLDIKSELIPIKYALASEIAGVLSGLSGGGTGVLTGTGGGSGGLGGNRSGSRSTGSRGTTGGFGGSGFGGSGVGGVGGIQGGGAYSPTGAGAVGGIGGLGNTSTLGGGVSGTRSAFSDRLQQIVNRAATGGGGGGGFQILGDVKIIPDERTNSLLIFANDQDMTMIKKIIDQMDVVLAQVIIEGIVMEVSLDDAKNMGVAVGQKPKQFSSGKTGGGILNNNNDVLGIGSRFLQNSALSNNLSSFPQGSGFGYFGQIGPTWDVALQAIATDSTINVLSRPRVQTSHAIEASLFIGDTVPYVTGTISDISGSRSQYQQLRVGITLNVLPLVNSEGLVVMDISESIQQLGNSVTIDGNPVPTTTERSASAKVAVKDGDPVILGGFISSTKSTSKSGVPYLKDIPILGALFRSKNDSTKRTELMVLLRPTVLRTPKDASDAAQRERTQMPGIFQAEKQFNENEKNLKRKVGIPIEGERSSTSQPPQLK